MLNVIVEVRTKLNGLSKGKGLTTGAVRDISSELYKKLEDKSIDNVLALCEDLLDERDWALGVIAYDWAFRVRKQYNDKIFFVFENWLKTYVTGWGDCDDFCTHAFGELLSQNNELFKYVLKWTEDPNFCVRRAAAVILIYPIKHNKYVGINPFLISDALMMDEHYLVLKGYGWMLKVLSQGDPGIVYDYLVKNRDIMPRVSFRYALEKFDGGLKEELMRG
jgi:3-methyladenine DNA glycosylase AlkD